MSADRRPLTSWAAVAVAIAMVVMTAIVYRPPRRERTDPSAMLSAFYAAKDGSAAVAALDKAIDTQPDRADLYALRGVTLRDLGRLEEAERDLGEATRLDPGDTTAWHELVAVQDWRRSADRAALATAYRQHVVNGDPRSAINHRNLARLLQAAGDVQGAEREFEAAVSLAPAETSYYLEFSEYLQQRGAEGRMKAIAVLEDALGRNVADRGRICAEIGRLAFTQQDYRRAADAYRDASTSSPLVREYREMAEEAERRTRTALR